MKRASLLIVLSLLCSVATATPAAAREFTIEVTTHSTADVGLGEPFRFEVAVSNVSEQGGRATILLSVAPANDPAASVHVERIVENVPPGSTISVRRSVITGQWFPSAGRFVVMAEVDDAQGRLPFEVSKSPIRVPRFQDVAAQLGAETITGYDECARWSAGAAWADIDGDRDLDLFMPRIEETDSGGGVTERPDQLWVYEGGGFVEEGASRGVTGGISNGLGAVFADYDNDGDQDLYVAADGPNILYRNDGSGRFENVSEAAGVAGDAPSQSASWGDYDSDGYLDLYVSNHVRCISGPVPFPDKLYHNNGDGTFTDVTDLLEAEGSTAGAGFQLAWFDYDDDGDVDLYLANDFYGRNPEPNFLWRNDGPSGDSWKFTDVSVASGAGVTMNSMGLAIGDYDRDMDFDVAISNIYQPMLLNNQGNGTFRDRAEYARIARRYMNATSPAITWGTTFYDLNNDGWEDLFFAAGRLAAENFEPDELFTNARNGKFLDHSAPSGVDDPGVGRGAAFADYDADGRMDFFLINQDGQPRLWHNVTSAKRAHWLEVDPVGTESNRDGCGARLVLKTATYKLLRQVFCGGTSLGVGSADIVHFGLGRTSAIEKLTVTWPSGVKQVVRNIKVDRLISVTEAQS